MSKTTISTTNAPQAIGPYSQAIESNGFLYISGQLPIDPKSGDIVGGGISEQARMSLKNIGAILAAKDLGYSDVVKTTVFLTDLADFTVLNGIYGEYFAAPYPARSCVQVAALPKGAKVEIEVIAAVK